MLFLHVILHVSFVLARLSYERTNDPVFVINPPPEELDLDNTPVFFFDLDHTLYLKKSNVYSDSVVQKYMQKVLEMSSKEARRLFNYYDAKYQGQILQGLVNHHKVDPVQFETWIDDEAKLELALQPDEGVIATLSKSAARNWIFTNSGKDHAVRVIKALGIMPFIEAVIYLDYSSTKKPPLKPHLEAFGLAMKYARVTMPAHCILVDDILANASGACRAGWKSIHFCEPDFCEFQPRFGKRSFDQCDTPPKIRSIIQMEELFPDLF